LASSSIIKGRLKPSLFPQAKSEIRSDKMGKNKRISVTTGIIVSLDTDRGLIVVSDAAGQVTKFQIVPAYLQDTDGNRIQIEELRKGDHVVINETGYMVMIRVLRIA